MLDGGLIWASSSGLAILEGAAPVTPGTVFGLANPTHSPTSNEERRSSHSQTA